MAGDEARNDALFDIWSLIHLAVGVAFGAFFPPWPAFFVMAAWEPFEICVLSPLVWRFTGHTFGHETWRNSLSDIAFDGAGVFIGAVWLAPFVPALI